MVQCIATIEAPSQEDAIGVLEDDCGELDEFEVTGIEEIGDEPQQRQRLN